MVDQMPENNQETPEGKKEDELKLMYDNQHGIVQANRLM